MLSSQRLWPISLSFWVAFIIFSWTELFSVGVAGLAGRDLGGRNTAAAGSSAGCHLGCGVMPIAAGSDDRARLFGPPATALVGANPVVGLKDGIDHRPGGLDRIFTCEERSVAVHGVAQKPFVGHFLCKWFFGQVELLLVPDERSEER